MLIKKIGEVGEKEERSREDDSTIPRELMQMPGPCPEPRTTLERHIPTFIVATFAPDKIPGSVRSGLQPRMTYLDRELDYWLRNASGEHGVKHTEAKKGGEGEEGREGKVARVWSLAGSYRRTKLPSRLVTLPSRYHDLISYEIASRSSSRSSLWTLSSIPSRFAQEKRKRKRKRSEAVDPEGRGETRINRWNNWRGGERYRWIIVDNTRSESNSGGIETGTFPLPVPARNILEGRCFSIFLTCIDTNLIGGSSPRNSLVSRIPFGPPPKYSDLVNSHGSGSRSASHRLSRFHGPARKDTKFLRNTVPPFASKFITIA